MSLGGAQYLRRTKQPTAGSGRECIVGYTLAVLAAALLVAGLAGGARAQLDDTELTPQAKSPSPQQWAILGGAKFGRDGELFEDSPTPFTVDFFSTAFSPDYLERPLGFFAGAECKDEETPLAELGSCKRRPAIYRFRIDEFEEAHIERLSLGGDPARAGFVGAVAWIDGERALAVGGTGTYPRREPPAVSGGDAEYAKRDENVERGGAGMVRAWLYEDRDGDRVGKWRELEQRPDTENGEIDWENGDELPDDMRALTALDCSPSQDGRCVAGGMQQLWRWGPPAPPEKPEEGFESEPEPVAPVTTERVSIVPNIQTPIRDFHYRVRQIRFKPLQGAAFADPEIVAVTSGCCGGPDLRAEGETDGVRDPGGARLLSYQSDQSGTWKTEPLSPLGAEDTNSAGAPLPDSYYGFVYRRGNYEASLSSNVWAIASPGGDPGQDSLEPGSRIVARVTGASLSGRGPVDPDPTDRKLDSLRLLAADGDYVPLTSPAASLTSTGAVNGSDGMLDWAVGRFKASEQGVAYTTNPSMLPLPSPLTCKLEDLFALAGGNLPACDLEPSNVTQADLRSKRLLAMPTYALNALSFVPQTAGQLAWAAGDRGALARLGGEGKLGGADEPDAPALLAGEATPFSERVAFDPFRPSLGQTRTGFVPALADRPLERLPERTLVPWGTADPSLLFYDRTSEQVAALAISRDGSEGWAVGGGPTLQHFDGKRWARCDIDGLGGVHSPDPACESLRPLVDEGELRTLIAVARIPLDHNDEFAAIAIGQGTVLHYHRGRWEPADDATRGIAPTGASPRARIAFRRSDDGWLLTSAGSGLSGPKLFHYGGGDWPDGRWVSCPHPECGDTSLFPTGPTGSNRGSISELRVAGDTVFAAGSRTVSGSGGTGVQYPFVLSKNPGKPWRQEHDPGCPPPSAPPDCAPPKNPESQAGSLDSLAVVELGDGQIAGWVLGRFGGANAPLISEPDELTRPLVGPEFVLLRRDPSGRWTPRTGVADTAEALIPIAGPINKSPQLLSTRAADGGERSFIMPPSRFGGALYPPLEYDPDHDRWGVLRAPFVSSSNRSGSVELTTQGEIMAAALDERGGVWVAARSSGGLSADPDAFPHTATYFYRYTDERRREVFADASSPISEPITGLVGTADGAVWVSTESERVYRYDQIAGWERARVKGWDRGRIVTRPSKALGLAVNEAGVGIVVGEDGRIADISPNGVALNPASGRRCSDVPPPCGTPRNLHEAAVAPDGSAIAGGDKLTLMWRPAGGQFTLIERPKVASSAKVTGLSMPQSDRAWLTLSLGRDTEIWAGTLTGDRWRWQREADTEAARDEGTGVGRFARLYAIEVQSDGRGLAVGHRGAMLERSPDGTWRRLKTGHLDSLYAIAFPPSGYGDGTIVGGAMGAILTRIDGRWRVARQADLTNPLTAGGGEIVGLALSGGEADGEVEAWAASQVNPAFARRIRQPAPHALLHYGSGQALVDPPARARPLLDAPPHEQGELTLAALGRSECQLNDRCPPFQGTNLFNERITHEIQAELRARRQRSGNAFAALYTGDINVAPGRDEESRKTAFFVPRTHTQVEPNVAHEQWREFGARPLIDDGVPVFAALGKKDLSRAHVCDALVGCEDTQRQADAGTSSQWRKTFAQMPAPWGSGQSVSSGEVEFRRVRDRSVAQVEAHEGGARTHYALDMVRDGEQLARLVFVDNSLSRSLTASDADQNPIEGEGGQAAWLERMLCIQGETCAGTTTRGSRKLGVPTIVVSNTPTYSYGPGGLGATQADGSVLETLMLRHRATAAVSGRLGWNGLYYTLAPGVHSPCPGEGYPESPPTRAQRVCGGSSAPETPPAPGARSLSEALAGAGVPLPAAVESATGAADELTAPIPHLVASTAGGRFGPDGRDDGEARDGFWHGYSVLRVRKSGEVIVEQRPILDWVGITAQEHTLRPGQKMALRGYGREPLGTDTSVRMLEIDSPAITHRYDLLLADEERPWLPKEDADGNYVPLPPDVATIDRQSGLVRVGRGNRPRVYAIGLLSVGDKAATWPLVFEPRRSFRPKPPAVVAPALPNPIVSATGASLPAPPQPPVPSTQAPSFELPPPPAIPGLPAQSATPPQPPAPPVPPPPPVSPQATPLDLVTTPVGLNVAPQATVIPPPAPPIQPAPPGSARREARQRQAATEKSGADGAGSEGRADREGAQPRTDLVDDMVNSSTRLEPGRDRLTILAVRNDERASAWVRGLAYGGGTGVIALILALGWSVSRPTPRRREPQLPVPAWSRNRSSSRR